MAANAKTWWQKPLRVIQPNLQVRDTDRIDPERLAQQIKDMSGNTIVFNVGGIYAWYPTQVAYHTENEFLPKDFDLLEEVIRACHKRDIRFIARFDFSKAADYVYLQRPQWFARSRSGEPEIIGAKRPGDWSLLMSTCINGAYRGEAVAVPVLDEVLSRYAIDGIFFNAPGYVPCWCEGCRRKYRAAYGTELPDDKKEFAPDWASSCMRDNIDILYAFAKQKSPEVPMILYYNLYRDNIFDRAKTADMLCTEPQDILSLGHHHIPEFWKPALSIKLGRSLPDRPVPFGIVHSSPGMDWRHTGLPPAEYRFWLSQIPAHGGSIWHSLTGVPDTIGDKRILETVGAFNAQVEKVDPYMEGAEPLSEVALMWTADASAEGWADGLLGRQIPFDVLLAEQAVPERLARYKALIVPEGMKYTEEFAANLAGFVRQGGHVVAEGAPPERKELLSLFAISGEIYESEPLAASYLRFEGQGNPLQKGLEQTELIAHRGKVVYCRPDGAGCEVLATLVPPFSPLESVGAPPERASLPVSHTDLPLALLNRYGQGTVLYMPFSLSHLINEYKLGEHYQLLENAIGIGLGETRELRVTGYHGLQATLFAKGNNRLVHLVNGVGRRPLATAIPLHDIEVELRLPADAKVTQVRQIISGSPLEYRVEQDRLFLTVPRLDVWECLLVECD
ncbi:alpha-amylase family protein [Paenibacillus hamazuiensis]|uniref:alpha-amylase family protein n=1 Tax=Paenibacillus hamazuiensis TaxID=2936508 RepID=UPI0020101519|nr:alpha-amylase family protein [Paenibacillus hamazuiensis]